MESKEKVKNEIADICVKGNGCIECRYFNGADIRDEQHYCCLRDNCGRIPAEEEWDISSALKDKVADLNKDRECIHCKKFFECAGKPKNIGSCLLFELREE